MEQNHCGHLGFSFDTILACFDPEVILLLKEQVSAQSDLRFEKTCRKLIFKMAAVVAGHLGCSIGTFSYFVSHKRPNAHHRFNWIIEEMSKI